MNTAKTRSMKMLAAALLTTLFLPVAAQADKYHNEWYACRNDDDCIVVPGNGCAKQAAVNRHYLDDYNAFVDAFNRAAECVGHPPDDPQADARCNAGRCVLDTHSK